MAEILDNIQWALTNRSNFEVNKEDLEGIVDIPYFPANNYVNLEGDITFYTKSVPCKRFFCDSTSLTGILEPTVKEQRIVLLHWKKGGREVTYGYIGDDYPQYRQYFTMTYTDERLYIFGGYVNGRCSQDLWELVQGEWINHTPSFPESCQWPGRRKNSSLLLFNNKLYLFGGKVDVAIGEFEKGSESWITLNDLWVYDLNSKAWTQYDPQSLLPRELGKVVWTDGSLVHIVMKDKVIVYNLETDSIQETITGLSTPIEETTQILYKNGKFYILNEGNNLSNNSLWEYNSSSYTFTKVTDGVLAANDTGEAFIYNTKDLKLGGVSYTRTQETFIPKKIQLGDLSELEELDIILPPAAYLHNTVYIGNNRVFFFSGADWLKPNYVFYEDTWIVDITDGQTELISTTAHPAERVYAGLCYDKDRNCVWLFGGWNGSHYYNDLWKFDLEEKTWTQVAPEGTLPEKRQKVGMAYLFDRVYIIGGYNDAESFNDFWYYDISENKWVREYPIDVIPFGTDNKLFTYKDRLWFFNGEVKLYRYYYERKQFVPVGLDTSHYSVNHPLNTIKNERLYLVAPLEATLIEDRLFIFGYYPSSITHGGRAANLAIDFNTFEVISIDDCTKSIVPHYLTPLNKVTLLSINPDTNLGLYYLNYSPIQPLTKNQLPHPDYSIGALVAETSDGTKLMDKSGIFQIKSYWESVTDKTFSFVTDSTTVTEEEIQSKNALFDSTGVVEIPWFLYSLKSLNFSEYYEAPLRGWFEKEERIFIIDNNGKIVKINTNDGSKFDYLAELWKGSVFGYKDGIIYCFGGEPNTWGYYSQHGIRAGGLDENALCHQGFMKFDLNYNEFQVSYLQTIPDKFERIDYEIVKEYLIDLAQDNITDDLDKEHVEAVREQLYLQTQKILTDLSGRQITYENGTRPSARTLAQSAQIGSKIYVFGGAYKHSDDFGCPHWSPLSDCHYYDIDENKWVSLAKCPIAVYNGAVVWDGDDKIYLIGGYKKDGFKGPNKEIWIYSISKDTWTKLLHVPLGYRGRGKPTCFRKENKIVIIYGAQTQEVMEGEGCPHYIDYGIDDIWVLDLEQSVFYRAARAYPNEGLIIQNNEDLDNRYIELWPSAPYIEEVTDDNRLVTSLRKWLFDIVEKEYSYVEIQPDAETYYSFSMNYTGETNGGSPSTAYLKAFYHKGKLYLFGYIIPPQNQAVQLCRFYYVDENNVLRQITRGFPISGSAPKAVVYDNNKYMYCYWNGYNLWRLNLDYIEEDWFRAPPNPDLEKSFVNIDHAFYYEPSNEIIFCSIDGCVVKYHAETNCWLLNKEVSWENSTEKIADIVIADEFLYYFKEKSLWGKIYNVLTRQYDCFYFNLLKLQVKHWNFMSYDYLPSTVKRKRLYVINKLGHVMYAWTRIKGKLDLEISLPNFYRADELRIYCDYHCYEHPEMFQVKVRYFDGWKDLGTGTSVVNDQDWSWDTEYYRRYKKLVGTNWIYSDCPPNFVKYTLQKPVDRIRIVGKAPYSISNYIAHLNDIRLLNTAPKLEFTDATGNPIFNITIEPFYTEESIWYGITVTNSSSSTVTDVKTYIKDDETILFSKDLNEWRIADQDNPLELAAELLPGNSVSFWIKAISTKRPITEDLIVMGTV